MLIARRTAHPNQAMPTIMASCVSGRQLRIFTSGRAQPIGGIAIILPDGTSVLKPPVIRTVSCKAGRTLESVRFASFATGNTSRLDASLSRALGLATTPFTGAVWAEQSALAGNKWARANQTESERYAVLLC